MVDVLAWLAAVEILGILALPFCFVIFRRLPDRGITLAKPLALVLFSYVLWVAGLTQLVPNTRITIIVILVLAAAASIMVLRNSAERILAFLKEEWRTLAVAEALFLAFFFLWIAIISEIPAINHTEKPMDFGFMNAVLQSRYFPPEDPWLAGHSISYYYFGHFIMAFLAKLTAVPSSVGYNLAVAMIPGLLAIGSFGLVYNLVRLSGGTRQRAMAFGLVAPALLILMGNLEGALEFVHLRGWGGDGFWQWVGIKGLEGGSSGSGGYPDQTWWWWRASRVIDTLADGQSLDYTITEFPAFSFILGDLHPHVMSLPFLVLGLSLGLNMFRSEDEFGLGWLRRHPVEAVAIALFTGSLAFINIWDLPTIAAVLVLLVFLKSYGHGRGDLQRAVWKAAAVLVPILSLGVIMFLPFYLTLGGQASGILPLQDVSTRPFLFFVAIGLLFVLGLSFVLRQLSALTRPGKEEAPLAGLILVIAIAPLLIWAFIVFILTLAGDGLGRAFSEVGGRVLWVLPVLAIVAVAAFSAAQRVRRGSEVVAAFPLLLVAMAFYLLAGAELFYVVDFFGGAFRRMNTVFKVYYQAWLLLGLAGAYGLYYWTARHPVPRSALSSRGKLRATALRLGNLAWLGLVAALVLASAYYPVGAVLDRTGVLNQRHSLDDNTLDGLAFVQAEDPGEYAAIQWLRDDAPWGRIVEAVGDDYSAYGRISSSTGLPTLLGWKGHELQWRGSSAGFAGREEDVAQIYQSSDQDAVRLLLENYQVRYIYVGRRERTTYGDRIGDRLSGFERYLRTAFEQSSVVIYEVLSTNNEGSEGARGDDGQGPG